MPETERQFTEAQAHRHFAISLNNLVWSLLEKSDRSDEDCDTMVHAAHASCYHWMIAGTAENRTRGEWLISRVYAVLGSPEPALHHALAALDACTDNHLAGFDLAYAHEACARAYAANGEEEECRKYGEQAVALGEKIEGDEDRRLFFSDLRVEPWFGLFSPPA